MGGKKRRGSAGAAALQRRGVTRCGGLGALQAVAAVCAVPAPGLRLSVGGEVVEGLSPRVGAARRLCRRRPLAATGAEAAAAAGREEAAAARDQRPLLLLVAAAVVPA